MKLFLGGVLLGFFLTAGAVAVSTLTYLRDGGGYEVWTAEEYQNIEANVNLLMMELMRLRMILAKGGCA